MSSSQPLISADIESLRGAFGLGVAGNFAGHLEQAGEAADFVGVESGAAAPKGIFPFYAPGRQDFLGNFPVASDHIVMPSGEGDPNLQIEPELGVICTLTEDANGALSLQPRAIGAFNDCSIRRAGAAKISHKKNWGPGSKGLAPRLFPIDDISADGPTATFRLASFLRRGDRTDAYGVDSPLPAYTYYGQQLLDWIAERLVNQTGAPETPLEPVGEYLRQAGAPDTVLIGIGATRYTPFGETTFLQPGDESVVVVYDARLTSPEGVEEAVADGREDQLEAASVLRQRVVAD